MPLDINAAEIQLLLRQFERGDVVLFAGAGFSVGARNQRQEEPPTSRQLCELLASECGWKYEDEDLPTVYEQAELHLGTNRLRELFARVYRDCSPAPWHETLSQWFWYRIYTTNVDDVIQHSYSGASAQRLRTVVCPSPYQEQDLWFSTVQCVHLHGSVIDPAKGFTFGPIEFGSQTAFPNPWYQSLIDDMYSKSVVFVGTRLSEPPFYHYLQLRTQRSSRAPEFRAKAFVVSPHLSRIRVRQLEAQNMVVLDVTAEEFVTTLNQQVHQRVSDRFGLIRARYPHQLASLTSSTFDMHAEILKYFDIVSVSPPVDVGPTASRTQFYLGAEPTWEDIRNGVDATRSVSVRFLDLLNRDADGIRIFIIVGHAGSGKSTTQKRLAFDLAALGRRVYYAKSVQALQSDPILDFLSNENGRHIYFVIDDAAAQLDVIADVLTRSSPSMNATFVLADRPHVMDVKSAHLGIPAAHVLEMPELDSEDCNRILDKLDGFGFLGALQGKPRREQLRDFLGRSRNQLLVAMKEATSGRGFDIIIASEYASLTDDARMAYIVSCACYMHGAPVRRRHLLACLDGTDIQKANVIANDLKQVLVPWKDSSEYLSPRHRVIARQVMGETAPVGAKLYAAVRYLSQIAAEINPDTVSRRTPEFIAYRGIINFDNVLFMCGPDYESIGLMYNELQPLYRHDFLFWLQWGRAEVHFDHFDVAENHLNQSLGIRDAGNFQARHYLGVLYLKRAAFEDNAATAAESARRGEDILRAEITARQHLDAYAAAALVTHKLRFLRKWGSSRLAVEIEDLYELAKSGYDRHPFDDAMREAYQQVFRAYLMRAVHQGDE